MIKQIMIVGIAICFLINCINIEADALHKSAEELAGSCKAGRFDLDEDGVDDIKVFCTGRNVRKVIDYYGDGKSRGCVASYDKDHNIKSLFTYRESGKLSGEIYF